MVRRGVFTVCDGTLESSLRILDALRRAMEPDFTSPRLDEAMLEYAEMLAAGVRDAERKRLRGLGETLGSGLEDGKFRAWRQDILMGSLKVGLLLTCDVAEAVEMLCKQRGQDGLSEEERRVVIRHSDELQELMGFATSSTFFRLRGAIGFGCGV